ncbi:MAG TPA: sugar phosphate isomerase/epimerase, partial [Candidatus Methylomirabilis sp.]|nr:sugar phosphate isomerase/epimerase [Candidatus Methylomirabilis sp.]
VDSYHLQRSGNDPGVLCQLSPGEIAYVQYSDVPLDGLKPGMITDRLPPGEGTVPFVEFFQRLGEQGYRGYLSYEAPNPSAWARNPEEVAREALLATRKLLAVGRSEHAVN